MKNEDLKNKKQLESEDDGRTLANMNVEGFRWYTPEKEKKNHSEITKMDLTFKERLAIIKGAYKAFFVPFISLLLGFALVIYLMHLWLS